MRQIVLTQIYQIIHTVREIMEALWCAAAPNWEAQLPGASDVGAPRNLLSIPTPLTSTTGCRMSSTLNPTQNRRYLLLQLGAGCHPLLSPHRIDATYFNSWVQDVIHSRHYTEQTPLTSTTGCRMSFTLITTQNRRHLLPQLGAGCHSLSSPHRTNITTLKAYNTHARM